MHEPIFRFDSREKFHPLAAESVAVVPAKVVRNDGPEVELSSLEALPPDGGRLNFPPHPEQFEERLQEQFGKVGYRRELKGGGFTWIQYWLWYLHNPKRIYVAGDHEGDWEFVQIGHVEETPICVTASQHHSGGGRMWWDVERRDGRPVIYVARDSHANFFTPVENVLEWRDDADGEGEEMAAIEWREFGSWATWPGLWGNSTGEGRSPQSPGSQGERWNAPHRYHSKTHR